MQRYRSATSAINVAGSAAGGGKDCAVRKVGGSDVDLRERCVA